MYKIRRIEEDEFDELILFLHRECFSSIDPLPSEEAYWWVVTEDGEAVAFAGMEEAVLFEDTGYISRVGVIFEHRGHGLQRRLTRTLERFARKLGWKAIVSDTTDNVPSANNFIKCGYLMFEPEMPWSLKNATYWKKYLTEV